MRWQKQDSFLALEIAQSVERGEDVLIVSSNAWDSLPQEFKEQVDRRNAEACAAQRKAVAAWAELNGFLPVSA